MCCYFLVGFKVMGQKTSVFKFLVTAPTEFVKSYLWYFFFFFFSNRSAHSAGPRRGACSAYVVSFFVYVRCLRCLLSCLCGRCFKSLLGPTSSWKVLKVRSKLWCPILGPKPRKWCPGGSKMRPRGVENGSLEASGAALGGPWRAKWPPGAAGRSSAPSSARFFFWGGAKSALPEGSWGDPGASWVGLSPPSPEGSGRSFWEGF